MFITEVWVGVRVLIKSCYSQSIASIDIIIVNKAMLNANTVLYAIKFNEQNTNLTNIQ